ncbi:hypothetical protein MYX78_09630 [Acidobacteria bacterium AH-259-G07]|nr:hypothetical protein [Acidobacteria bacterium AH-259-G07]
MSNCCQDKSCEVETLRRSQSNTLWIVLGINALVFGGEVVVERRHTGIG